MRVSTAESESEDAIVSLVVNESHQQKVSILQNELLPLDSSMIVD